MEKLLNEVTSKYKPYLTSNQQYLQRLEKKTMIQEINMLAQALISSDRASKKQNDNNEKIIKRLQSELSEAEEQIKGQFKSQLILEKDLETQQMSQNQLLD